jgi:hypothetical protein
VWLEVLSELIKIIHLIESQTPRPSSLWHIACLNLYANMWLHTVNETKENDLWIVLLEQKQSEVIYITVSYLPGLENWE